jgi:hypothetical protein
VPLRDASKGAGEPSSIPDRTSSKRKADQSFEEMENEVKRLKQSLTDKRSKLKHQDSYDSTWWGSNASLVVTQQELAELHMRIQYRQYRSKGGNHNFEQWCREDNTGRDLSRKSSALSLTERLYRDQAAILRHTSKLGQMRASWAKLFKTGMSGFAAPASSDGKRQPTDQSIMRRDMARVYCNVHDMDSNAALWDHAIGKWEPADSVVTAHLFPWKSREWMELIFGPGTRDDLFTSKNGLFLHKKVEIALEKGMLTIVPDVLLDTPDPSQPTLSIREVNRRRIKEWQKKETKEFKFRVLDPKDTSVTKQIYSKAANPNYPIETIAQLHNRRLRFRGDARPRTRYLWWVHVNAIVNASVRQARAYKADDSSIVHEVERVGHYWGTMGLYMKSEHLRAIADLVGHTLQSNTPGSAASSVKSIKEGII